MKIHNYIIPTQDDFRNKVIGNLVSEYDQTTEHIEYKMHKS